MMLPRTMVGFTALQEQGSVTTKGQANVPGLGCLLPVDILMSEACVELTSILI